MMLEQILAYLNNWFLVDVYENKYIVKDGGVELPFLQSGQYFRITGSVFNDGLHQYQSDYLFDEEFDGAVWALAVPRDIVSIAEEMELWQAKNGEAVSGPYQSESFGGYSYSKVTGSNGSVLTVFDVFSSRLSAYKKPRELGYVKPSRPHAPAYRRPFNPDFPWR